jgi:hypothetical protein
MFRELVANISAPQLNTRLPELVEIVDDVLSLASIAQRCRSASMG